MDFIITQKLTICKGVFSAEAILFLIIQLEWHKMKRN